MQVAGQIGPKERNAFIALRELVGESRPVMAFAIVALNELIGSNHAFFIKTLEAAIGEPQDAVQHCNDDGFFTDFPRPDRPVKGRPQTLLDASDF
jgi:hypothetical protein